MIQPSQELFNKHHVTAMNGIVNVTPNVPFRILVANYGFESFELRAKQPIGTLIHHNEGVFPTQIQLHEVLGLMPEQIYRDDTDELFLAQDFESAKAQKHPSKEEIEPIKHLNDNHLSKKNQQRLRALLKKYKSLYDDTFPGINTHPHDIELKEGARPIHQFPYRAGLKAREVERAELDKMLKQGVIEPATSPWGSPVVFAPKKDGNLRLCVDYRRLNALTIKDSYPILRMDECIDSLGSAKNLTALDCRSGFWQIPLTEKPKT